MNCPGSRSLAFAVLPAYDPNPWCWGEVWVWLTGVSIRVLYPHWPFIFNWAAFLVKLQLDGISWTTLVLVVSVQRRNIISRLREWAVPLEASESDPSSSYWCSDCRQIISHSVHLSFPKEINGDDTVHLIGVKITPWVANSPKSWFKNLAIDHSPALKNISPGYFK